MQKVSICFDLLLFGICIRKTNKRGGRNTTAVLYTLENTTERPCALTITPFLKFAPKEIALAQAKTFTLENNRIRCDGYTLYIHTDGQLNAQDPQWQLLSYPEDAKDGRPEMGLTGACCRVSTSVLPGQTAHLEVIFSLQEHEVSGWQILSQQVSRLQALESSSRFSAPVARQLAISLAALFAF